MPSAETMPDEVRVSPDGRRLTLSWLDRDDASLTAVALRRACRCAWCTRDRIVERFQVDDDQAVAGAQVLGSHGLHLTFADGHARGVFPWAYLRELAAAADRGEVPASAPR